LKEEYFLIADDGVFENKIVTPLIKNQKNIMRSLITKEKKANEKTINTLKTKKDKKGKPDAGALKNAAIREEWQMILNTKADTLFRLYYLLCKILLKVESSDIRSIEMKHNWDENKIFGFKSLHDIIGRVRQTCFNKETANQDDTLGYELGRILKDLKCDTL
jgi:hypothetical protein